MRKITEDAIRAFYTGSSFKRDNTEVSINYDGSVCLELHGNLIAIRYTDDKPYIEIRTAGYSTLTTKERLNGLNDVNVHHKKGVLYLNDKVWGGDWIRVD